MEFLLNNKSFEYMGTVYRNSFTHEVTTESIIPDSLPDAQRVIETGAMVCLRSKEVDDGRITVTGSADVSIIYADDEGCVKSTNISIPFSASEENSNIKSGALPVVTVKAASAEARMLNPRKLLIRCDILIEVVCFTRQELHMMLPDDNTDKSWGVQMLTQESDVRVLTDISEKTFAIREEYSIQPTKPLVGEILRTKLDVELEEVKGVGNKAILKGMSRVCILYRPEKGGEPVSAEFSTAFSQIMELGVQSDGLEFKVELVPTNVYFETDSLYSTEERQLIVEIHLLAQCLAYRNEKVVCITDAYCSKYEMDSEITALTIDSVCGSMEKVEFLRGVIDTPRQVGNVVGITAVPTVVYQSRNGENMELKTSVCVNVLYISEDGVLVSVSKKFGVSSAVQWESGVDYRASATVQGEPAAVISTEGIEVKLNLVFRLEYIRSIDINAVSAINVDAESPKDMTEMPSIVIKRFGNEDSLWKLAKEYCSVSDAILKANNLENEPEPEAVLIIPKVR